MDYLIQEVFSPLRQTALGLPYDTANSHGFAGQGPCPRDPRGPLLHDQEGREHEEGAWRGFSRFFPRPATGTQRMGRQSSRSCSMDGRARLGWSCVDDAISKAKVQDGALSCVPLAAP